jgi:competence protein ComEA
MKKTFRILFLLVTLLIMPTLALASSVDINHADVATLSTALKGIGDKKAQAIIDYRDEHGSFQSIDELVNVPGIGDKMLQRLRSQLSLGEK